MTACCTDDAVETNNPYIAFVANIYGIIDARQIRWIECSNHYTIEGSISGPNAARDLERPVSSIGINSRLANNKLIALRIRMSAEGFCISRV